MSEVPLLCPADLVVEVSGFRVHELWLTVYGSGLRIFDVWFVVCSV